MSDKGHAIRLHEADNVALALATLSRGETVLDGVEVAAARVPRGHKVALVAVKKGEPVLKYGQIIGFATDDIAAGEHVHTQNLGVGEIGDNRNARGTDIYTAPMVEPRTFKGYVRKGGGVGTRNYIGILTSVNCSATVSRLIATACERQGLLDEFDNIDGIIPLVHGTGCGMSSSGEGFDVLQQTIHGYARNPNFGGVLLVGLGCEVMQLPGLLSDKGLTKSERFARLIIQQEGGTQATVERGVQAIRELARLANEDQRSTVPVSELVLGMQCGASDAWSGVSGNPALGVASDLLVAHGGTSILSETPEIYGAEHLLLNRGEAQEIGEKLMERIAWWEDYCARNQGDMDNNPSPGNKMGGLTTIFEKSLGAVAKGGRAPLSGIYKFGEPIDRKGFAFVDTPGYDPCSATGQIASGATVIAFTTGRGSVSGFKPAPCIKIATNSEMYRMMQDDMDIDAGPILSAELTIAEAGQQIFDTIIATASGERTKSEIQGFGDHEFVPWQIGAVM